VARKLKSNILKRGITASALLDTLQNTIYPKEAYAMLREVRSSTGYVQGERYADAIVMSLWPSRGLWLAGIEVKINRYDWLKELKNAEKSAAIQKYCHYWIVVTTLNIIEEGELPITWGHIEVEDGKSKIKVHAPKLNPEPLDLVFVASMLRNESKKLEKSYQEGQHYASQNFIKDHEEELAKVEELQDKIFQLEQEVRRGKYLLEDVQSRKNNLEAMIEKIRAETGVSFWNTTLTEDYIKILKLSNFIEKQKEFDGILYKLENVVKGLAEIKNCGSAKEQK